jgi:hypothetical protein
MITQSINIYNSSNNEISKANFSSPLNFNKINVNSKIPITASNVYFDKSPILKNRILDWPNNISINGIIQTSQNYTTPIYIQNLYLKDNDCLFSSFSFVKGQTISTIKNARITVTGDLTFNAPLTETNFEETKNFNSEINADYFVPNGIKFHLLKTQEIYDGNPLEVLINNSFSHAIFFLHETAWADATGADLEDLGNGFWWFFEPNNVNNSNWFLYEYLNIKTSSGVQKITMDNYMNNGQIELGFYFEQGPGSLTTRRKGSFELGYLDMDQFKVEF